jgi:CelD/BcsL family acetyltransferase involved in cellulose biosynthesis
MPPQPKEWFRNLKACLGRALEIHVASYQNRPVAGILTAHFKNTVVYKYGGSDPAYHKLGPMPFLLWRAIQEAKSQTVQTFDFGRSDYYNQGLIDFKDRWAGERRLMTYWRSARRAENLLVNDGLALRAAKQFFGFLPNSMLKAAGVLLYRHIG